MNFHPRTAIRASLLLAALFVVPREGHAQLADGARIAVGTRVWVRTRDGAEGAWQFEHASPDSLTLRRRGHESDELLSIPWSAAERVDTMAIARPSLRRVLVGSAAGALVGALVVYLGAALSPCDWDGEDCPAIGFIILSPAIVGTGLAVGGTVGYRRRDWHWSTAWRAPMATPQEAR